MQGGPAEGLPFITDVQSNQMKTLQKGSLSHHALPKQCVGILQKGSLSQQTSKTMRWRSSKKAPSHHACTSKATHVCPANMDPFTTDFDIKFTLQVDSALSHLESSLELPLLSDILDRSYHVGYTSKVPSHQTSESKRCQTCERNGS